MYNSPGLASRIDCWLTDCLPFIWKPQFEKGAKSILRAFLLKYTITMKEACQCRGHHPVCAIQCENMS